MRPKLEDERTPATAASLPPHAAVVIMTPDIMEVLDESSEAESLSQVGQVSTRGTAAATGVDDDVRVVTATPPAPPATSSGTQDRLQVDSWIHG